MHQFISAACIQFVVFMVFFCCLLAQVLLYKRRPSDTYMRPSEIEDVTPLRCVGWLVGIPKVDMRNLFGVAFAFLWGIA